MLAFQNNLCRYFSCERFYSTHRSAKVLSGGKKFQHTVLLPKTNFPSRLNPKDVAERDMRIQKECQFLDCYKWQRKYLKGEEFVLHDGPPYANGKPHIGHAINKIMKDTILRSQMIQGRRIHFVPGWDCHGLPIELIALKNLRNSCQIIEIREKAKELAVTMSDIQKEGFKQWGVLGDWVNECYYTFDFKYITNQLQMFWRLYEKGVIYYDLKPVYWSPSSRTALAEAELLYEDHISKAVIVRFEVVQKLTSEPLYILVWTTTPWTLPFNKGVSYSSEIQYSAVKISNYQGLYIIAKSLINDLSHKLEREISIQYDVTSEILKKLSYKHPWYEGQIMKTYAASNVNLSGTGLVHTAPAHGHEDFLLALANALPLECFVNEKGCYTSDMGDKLAGLNVLEEGSKTVIDNLSSEILLLEDYKHSYPYDWRTKKPVIIRACSQWFIDTKQLKEKAIENLKDIEVPIQFFQTKLRERSYWCVSRQRTWGVPIPAFFHKVSNRPLISKNLINHLSQMIETSGPDIWWTGSLNELFPDEICNELFVSRNDILKGNDIMDIWFDSGISWSYALDGKKADIYLEGEDQYTGWFQSSLLTSTAVGNGAPFKRILTHGFAVDDEGKKMSKSHGNVVDPCTVLNGKNALGVDTLRWWVACHSHHKLVPVSQTILKDNSETVQRFRHVFKYLLGVLDGISESDLIQCNDLKTVDMYLLNYCFKFYNSAIESYNKYNIHKVCSQILHFVGNKISSQYLTVVKDRLYCEDRHSEDRKACIYTINGILDTLCHAIAPILPHLAEEVYLYHPIYGGKKKLFFTLNSWTPPESWRNDSWDEIIDLLYEIKKEIVMIEKNTSKMSCMIEIDEEHFELLKNMQNGNEQSTLSEITQILQVADVCLKLGDTRKISITPSNASACDRCRRYAVLDNKELCTRCDSLLSKMIFLDIVHDPIIS